MFTARADHPLVHPRYPLSNGYDPDWVIAHQMGPNALWLLESLVEIMPIEPGMKVLDLGCGQAMTSIFLAREFGAEVWAADLWIDAADNERRCHAAGVGELVHCVDAEAHTLPFEPEMFDAIVSLDAYQYFGTADLYLGYLLGFLRTEGRLGCVMPAVSTEIGADVPEALQPYWDWEFCCFHSPEWWRTHWAKTGKVDVDHASLIEDGWRDWLRFNDIAAPSMSGWRAEAAESEHHLLTIDQGKLLGFTRITASKR